MAKPEIPIGVVAALFAIGSLVLARSSHRQQDVRVRIGLLEYGDAFTDRVFRAGMKKSPPDAILPIEITNTSNRPLDFFTDGNGWGDGTLTIEITAPGGSTRAIRCRPRAYTRNFPGFVRLQPGDTWVRNIEYGLTPGWSEICDALPEPGHPVRVAARLRQSRPMKTDPTLWVGDVESDELTVTVR